jgi:hypothetical protein
MQQHNDNAQHANDVFAALQELLHLGHPRMSCRHGKQEVPVTCYQQNHMRVSHKPRGFHATILHNHKAVLPLYSAVHQAVSAAMPFSNREPPPAPVRLICCPHALHKALVEVPGLQQQQQQQDLLMSTS